MADVGVSGRRHFTTGGRHMSTSDRPRREDRPRFLRLCIAGKPLRPSEPAVSGHTIESSSAVRVIDTKVSSGSAEPGTGSLGDSRTIAHIPSIIARQRAVTGSIVPDDNARDMDSPRVVAKGISIPSWRGQKPHRRSSTPMTDDLRFNPGHS
jgi:hypothetical protein